MRGTLTPVMLIPACLCLLLIWSIPARCTAPVVRIGIVTDLPLDDNRGVLETFQTEIRELLEGDFDPVFSPEKLYEGDWTLAGIQHGVETLLGDPDVDVVLTMGLIASNYVCRREHLPKPVIAPFVIDAPLQNLPLTDGASGVKNLCYLSMPCLARGDLTTFYEVVPFKHITCLVNNLLDESVPQLQRHMQNIADQMGVKITFVPLARTVEEAIAALPEDTDAVCIKASYHLSRAEYDKLIQVLIDRKLPSFSVLGQRDVERGVLMGLVSDDFFDRVARRTALNLQRILLGEDAGSIPVSFTLGQRLYINMRTARAIGVYPSWGILTEAELIDAERKDIRRHLTLADAMQEAMHNNLDLSMQEEIIAAGLKDVHKARSNLLPQIDLSALGLLIDEDRADASMGQQAEQSLTGTAGLTQVLFSEAAWANLSIQHRLQEARLANRESIQYDIALEAALAYLNILRAKTVERIQKDNLKLTRSNLEAARVRDAIGVAGPAEVYRWEAEIASSRKAVIEANAQRNLAEMELNRILNRPLEEPFVTSEVDLSDPRLMLSNEQLFGYIDNPWSFDIIRDFLVQEGVLNSPELAQFDALIQAAERRKSSAANAYWAPTLALQGEVSHLWWEDGAGTAGLDFGNLPISLSEADDTDWSVGLNLSLPLFRGGYKQAEHAQATREIRRLEFQREAVADLVEQRIRSSLHLSGASYAGINLSRAGAEAARQTLEVVKEAYARGTVSILELLDAQTAMVVADQVAANAVFNFLADYMQVQRSIASFDVLHTASENADNLRRFEKYIEDRKKSQP